MLRGNVKNEYDNPRMRDVARVALRLAEDGSFPGPFGEHGRRNEFVKRRIAALRAIDPDAVCEVGELGDEVRTIVGKHLNGEKEPYRGCLREECLGLETTWVTVDLALPGEAPFVLERCARCNFWKGYGRRFNTMTDIVKAFEERERGAMAMSISHMLLFY